MRMTNRTPRPPRTAVRQSDGESGGMQTWALPCTERMWTALCMMKLIMHAGKTGLISGRSHVARTNAFRRENERHAPTFAAACYTVPHGRLAQRLAQVLYTHKAGGSNPSSPTIDRNTAPAMVPFLVRAPVRGIRTPWGLMLRKARERLCQHESQGCRRHPQRHRLVKRDGDIPHRPPRQHCSSNLCGQERFESAERLIPVL